MLISLGIYLAGQRMLPPDDFLRAKPATRERIPLDPQERRNVLALLGICALVALFWAAFDQQGNTIVLVGGGLHRPHCQPRRLVGRDSDAWFLALNPLMIFVLAPLLIRMWTLQARRATRALALRKMAFGCLVPGGGLSGHGGRRRKRGRQGERALAHRLFRPRHAR